MRRPRRFFEILLWSATATVLVALLAAGILTNITLRSVEKDLPNDLFEQLHYLARIVEDLSEAVYAAQLTKAIPTSENFAKLEADVTKVQAAIVEMRNTYVFDNLIQASAFHAVVAPAITDAKLWLSEGVSGYGPNSATTLDIVTDRISQAYQKAKVLNHDSELAARSILNEQRDRLDRFLVRVNQLFLLTLVTAIAMVFLLIRQRLLRRREIEAQTERRRAEQALRESEATLKSIFRASPVGIGLVSDRVLKQVNDRLCEITGYSRDELIDQNARILYPTREEFERVGRDKYAQISERGTGTVETSWKTKNGTIVDVLLSSTPLDPTNLSVGVTFSALDITERKRAAAALRESEERFRELAELLPETIFEMDTSGHLTFVNQNAFVHFGFSKEDIERGLNGFEMISPEDRPRALENAKRVMRGEKIGLNEYLALRKDGSTFPVIMHSTAKFRDNKAIGLRGIVIDITETKKLEAQLRQAHKMEAIGTLAGGIAHDFNNLLHAVQGYTELLLLDKTENEEGYKELQEILLAGTRGSELTRQLLTFSRKIESRLQLIDLNRVVDRTRNLLERTIPKMIKIEMHLAGNLYHINADPSQVEQILVNLAVNARDAMPEGGKLSIETKNIILDEEQQRMHPELNPGKYVLLTVTDTGHGMDKSTLENIFDPFFTTKEVGKGTGLGLAMVYGIVKNHHGHITCRSEPEGGATFSVCFPAVEQLEEILDIDTGSREQHFGKENILLVDDDDSVRELGKRILQRFGHKVLCAKDGESALQIYDEEKERIDLVILDLIMPGIGGIQCLRKLLEIDPLVKVIVASGYSNSEQIENVTLIGAKAFIKKPYDLQQMLRAIQESLA